MALQLRSSRKLWQGVASMLTVVTLSRTVQIIYKTQCVKDHDIRSNNVKNIYL